MPDNYTIEGLFNRLPISISELARRSKISEVTAAGIRDGQRARLHSINRLLATFSELYGVTLTTDNVSGLNILKGRYGEGGNSRRDDQQNGGEELEEVPAA